MSGGVGGNRDELGDGRDSRYSGARRYRASGTLGTGRGYRGIGGVGGVRGVLGDGKDSRYSGPEGV